MAFRQEMESPLKHFDQRVRPEQMQSQKSMAENGHGSRLNRDSEAPNFSNQIIQRAQIDFSPMESAKTAAQNDVELANMESPMPRMSAALLQEELLDKHQSSAANRRGLPSFIGAYHNVIPSTSAMSSGQHSGLKQHKEPQTSNMAGTSPANHSRIMSNQYGNLDFGPAGLAANAHASLYHPSQASTGTKENPVFRSQFGSNRLSIQSSGQLSNQLGPGKVESANNAAPGQGTTLKGNPLDFGPKNASSAMSNATLAQSLSPVKLPRNVGYAGLNAGQDKSHPRPRRQNSGSLTGIYNINQVSAAAGGASGPASITVTSINASGHSPHMNRDASRSRILPQFASGQGNSPSIAHGPAVGQGKVQQRPPAIAAIGTLGQPQGHRDKHALLRAPSDVMVAVGQSPAPISPSPLHRPQNSHAVANNQNNNRNINRIKINQRETQKLVGQAVPEDSKQKD